MKYLLYILGGLLSIVVFVSITHIAQNYSSVLTEITQEVGVYGVVSYVGITIVSVVIAPLGTGFLIPVAANSFGPFLAATYSIVGWVIGSLIAFSVVRKYGQRFVKDTLLAQKIHQLENCMKDTHFFLLLIVLRMLLPVDLMSYALGLGSGVSYRIFCITTVLGVSPFAYLFSYAAVSSVSIQIIVSSIGIFAFFLGLYVVHRQQLLEKYI